MFQTHAYDAWLGPPHRQGFFFWLTRMQLGGFPSRLFLFLAGVSLALRFAADARRGVDPRAARRRAMRRGLEVVGYGYLFRAGEWLLGGAAPARSYDILRVDILNCIGMSLVVAALVGSPRDLERRWAPLRLGALALAVAFAAPFVERLAFPAWVPRPLSAYLWGPRPLAYFPLLPWCAYVLTGQAAGLYWLAAQRRGQLGVAMRWTALVGAGMALVGQLGNHAPWVWFPASPQVPIPASPIAYFYRSGVCLVGGAAAYALAAVVAAPRRSLLGILGQRSLTVYWIHVELVYGRLLGALHRRLTPATATVALVILSGLMTALAAWLTRRGQRKSAGRSAAAPLMESG